MNAVQIYDKNIGVESFFIRLIDTTENHGVWLKFTFLKTTSGIMFKVWSTYFNEMADSFTSSSTFPIDVVKADENGIYWPSGHIEFAHGSSGSTEKHSWDFSWDVLDDNPMKLLPDFLYSNLVPTTKLITPYPRIFARGIFEVGDGVMIDHYDEFYGMQGHNWAPKHSREYVWMSFGSHLFLAEGFSTNIFPFKFTSFCVRHKSIDYKFSDILSPFRIGSSRDDDEMKWRLQSNVFGDGARVSCVGNPLKSTKLVYKNPDGSKMSCFNDNMASICVSMKIRDMTIGDCGPGALEFLKK